METNVLNATKVIFNIKIWVGITLLIKFALLCQCSIHIVSDIQYPTSNCFYKVGSQAGQAGEESAGSLTQ